MSDEIKQEEVLETQEAAEPTMEQFVHDENAPITTIRKLLEAGVHFGHQTRRWNPKMKKFIYGNRNGIYLIDLPKSVDKVTEAYKALKEIAEKSGKVLFVGTKPAAQTIVAEEAIRSGSFYITNRWLGGTLTNFRTIFNRIRHLKELEKMEEDGLIEKLPKKEQAALRKEKEKLSKNLEGIKEMRRIPQAIVVSDPTVEHNAVKEAKSLGIPVFAACSTSDDPDIINFPIPSNNDATSAIRLIIGILADAVVESKGGIPAYAYAKEEGEPAGMKDAVRDADAKHEARKAAIRAKRREQEERIAKLQAERAARFAARNAAKGEKPAEEVKEEAPAEKEDE